MTSLREIGREFLNEVFRPSRFEDPPLLRGVYYTSGTQEGTPIDRVMGSLARTFGVGQQALQAHGGQGRSYFLTRLLKDVVFQEADLVGANRRLEVQRRWLQRAAYTGAVAVTILAVLAWTTSFTRNQVYVNRTTDRIEEFQALSAQPLADPYDFDELLPRFNALHNVTGVYSHFGDSTPFLMGMGLYKGSSITEASTDAYQREMNRLLVPAIRNRLETHLDIGIGDPDFQRDRVARGGAFRLAEYLDIQQEGLRRDRQVKHPIAVTQFPIRIGPDQGGSEEGIRRRVICQRHRHAHPGFGQLEDLAVHNLTAFVGDEG